MDIHRCRFVDYTPHTITSTAFSHTSVTNRNTPNDLRLAVGRSNGDIEIWNPKNNWIHELTLPGSSGRSVEGLVWCTGEDESPRLFSIGGSTYITEWDLKTLKPVINYDCNAGTIWSIDISRNQKKLAVGCDDGSVVMIDISGGFGSLEHDNICQRQDARVLTIKWYENDMLIGGCSDGRIRSWAASGDSKGRILSTMRVDKSKIESTLVWSIIVLPKKKQIVSGDSTGSVKFWDLEQFTLLQSFNKHEADVLSLDFDVQEEKIFSAGVDRKIHQYNLIQTKSTTKWVHSFNRLLHSNDIRSMSIFESKSHNWLISGGVERCLVIQSVQNFYDGKYKKLSINQQKSNVLVNELKSLVVLWQDQTIKIWRITDGKYKLISKLTLNDDENITSVDMNDEGSLLAVARLSSVKVFELVEQEKTLKLKVQKIRDDNFDSLVQGGKIVKLYDSNKLIVVTSDEEIYKFIIDNDAKTISLDDEIELLESSNASKARISYISNINNLIISPDEQNLAISRFNGSIEIYSLSESSNGHLVSKLTSYPHLLEFTSSDKLVVMNEENKIYEFFIASDSKSLLTPWSKRNSEVLPKQFLVLERPQGVFVKGSKLWTYGSNWVSYFDLSLNLLHKEESKKRGREEEERKDKPNGDTEQNDGEDVDEDVEDKSYWITTKYRPVMKVENFGLNEIIVVERSQFSLPHTPAFNLPKLRI
ncbi:WD40 repeat-like protein [Suhomyces tanzawaensis NRRL Y-17324]|uniref:WD40 repeat-like protein n=1 Tax=Suhomyces tanzawaensis NRRL Y-17324 TaxID=984487 RepID=A0A1E4SG54_9ASCO|nr:WD40 repeat-like protein [Suhomyces tanzawaensis NRRL Y-17324]ODV78491.1 WD40 repeat-like protein [Suhomyces tanzawaensis NRRL Y-17324]